MKHFLFLCLLKRLAILVALPLVLFANRAIAASTTPKYVQGNYAVPLTPQTAVAVTFTAAQTAGNLNVVIVGWNDSTAQVSSLTDSKGNVYQLAVGPMVTGALSQSIYYAKNISAAAAVTNTVTVTFNTAASYPDIRILEYSGIDPVNPVDVVTGATGNGATSSSGAATTTNPTDLLVAADTVQVVTTGPASGFSLRLLTAPDGDIAEDASVTAAGTYTASAPLLGGGGWVMQMVAFRVAAPKPVVTAFVQGNYAIPSTPQTNVTVPYTEAQTAGNLNVVVVGWNDSTTHVRSLTDSKGNGYHLAIGPTVMTGALSQAIYYANNISAAAAGVNALTVTFDAAAANYPDIRILEYSGIDLVNPVDVVVGQSGNSAVSSSGAVTTTNARDLLVGANIVTTLTSGSGSGFTERLLTVPDGDIIEDQIVTATGSYSASANVAPAGGWVMQMVAFRTASSASNSGSFPPPPPPPPASGSSITLAWNANLGTSNPATNTIGYRLYSGLSSGNYTQSTDVGNTTTFTLSNLTSGSTYYFVITAYDSAGLESSPSSEVSYTAP
jgi:hypothetical protein